MLASPLLPSPRFDEGTTYRPAKDLEAFNKLLPPPIEFVEGSSSGLLAVAEGKYQAINETAKPAATADKRSTPAGVSKSPKVPQSTSPSTRMLPDIPIELAWPSGAVVGAGLNNNGNTCFLNSALQCLLHTPPLLHILLKHTKSEPCRSPKNSYCMACALRQVMAEVFSKSRSVTPYPVITKLQAIAKHMRRGRQEDSHEFLRYFVDALQRSSLAGLPGFPNKVDPKIAEKTWVYKVFGGLLRSRVKCLSCGYNSDTFDRMLDLSVDIAGMTTLRDALKKFVAVDHLRGADKYKCEKCKKPVNADKQFTIDEAPMVLTVHLKRFSPMGRKIAHPVAYPERLTLQPYMSEEKFGPSYTLYGVISHAGGGPNSGHYYAHVKASNGSWYEMNDESVMRQGSVPTNMRSAYMLFYIQEKGQALEAAVAGKMAAAAASLPPPVPPKTGLVANMKKRKIVESEDEDENPKSSKTPRKFIGPRLPTPPPQTPAKDAPPAKDPQAETLKKKIAAAASQKAKGALRSLDQYGDDEDEDDDVGEKVTEKQSEAQANATAEPTSSTSQSIAANSHPTPSSPSHPVAAAAISSPAEKSISPATFYGPSASKQSDRKRKSPDGEDDVAYTQWARKPISPPASSKKERRFGNGNPFSRLKGGNNLKERRDSAGTPVVRPRKKRFLM